MSFTVNVKITAPVGADSGPCDIYQNGDFYTTPVATNISTGSLIAGVDVVVNSSTNKIRVQNTGTCSNYEQVNILFT